MNPPFDPYLPRAESQAYVSSELSPQGFGRGGASGSGYAGRLGSTTSGAAALASAAPLEPRGTTSLSRSMSSSSNNLTRSSIAGSALYSSQRAAVAAATAAASGEREPMDAATSAAAGSSQLHYNHNYQQQQQQQQPSLKFLNRRKKSTEALDNALEADMNASVASSIYSASTATYGSPPFFNNTNISSNNPATAAAGGNGAGGNHPLTAGERIQKMTMEMMKLKEERDQVVQDKLIWLKKIKDDNVRLTLALQDIRAVKTRVLKKIEDLGMGDDGAEDDATETIHDDSSVKSKPRELDLNMKVEVEPQFVRVMQRQPFDDHIDVLRSSSAPSSSSSVASASFSSPIPIPTSILTTAAATSAEDATAAAAIGAALPAALNLEGIKSRTIYEQWDDEFQILDDSVQELVLDLLLSHITTFVRGHPLAQGLQPNVVREIVQEITAQVRSLLGKAVSGLIAAGTITLPLDDDGTEQYAGESSDQEAQSPREQAEEAITKLLHSSSIHSEIAGEVQMTLTYLYVLHPRPLPLTQEDAVLSIPAVSTDGRGESNSGATAVSAASTPVGSASASYPMSAPRPSTEYKPVLTVQPQLLEPRQFQRPVSPAALTTAKKRMLIIEAGDEDPATTSAANNIQTLQISPRSNISTLSSPRYMQPLNTQSNRLASTSPSIASKAASRLASSSEFAGGATSFRANSPKSPRPVGASSRSRVLRIDDDMIQYNASLADDVAAAGSDQYGNNNNGGGGGVPTLRQANTASPRSVPRYMQPKNVRAVTPK